MSSTSPTVRARRRRLCPLPRRTRSTAGLGCVGGEATRCTISSGSWPSGTSNDPGRPAVRTAPTMRESRKTRAAPRSTSNALRYQRPCHDTSDQGCTCRSLGLRGLGPPVGEAQRHPAQHAVLDRVEGRLGGAQPRLDADERVDVALDAGRAQLAQGLGRRAGQADAWAQVRLASPSTASSSGSKEMSGRAYSRWWMR